MKRLFLIGLMGLTGLMLARATPQTSDSDLRVAQLPPVVSYDGSTVTLPKGVSVTLPGTIYSLAMNSNLPNTGVIDPTGVTNFATSTDGRGELFLLAIPTRNGDISPVTTAVTHSGISCALEFYEISLSGTLTVPCSTGQTVMMAADFNPDLTAVDFSEAAISIGPPSRFDSGLNFNGCSSIATIIVGDGVSTGIVAWNSYPVNFNGCALTTASEDAFLAMCEETELTTPGQYGNLDISGGSNATPDGTGAADISFLIGTGWTITTN